MATWQLDWFLRNEARSPLNRPSVESAGLSTVPGIGPGTWNKRALADAQEYQPTIASVGRTKTLYRLYTEDVAFDTVRSLIKRYFDGATILRGLGLDAATQSADEPALIIEIVSSLPDALQRIIHLAGDIRVTNAQVSVLITRQDVTTFEVNARTPLDGSL